MNKLRLYRRAIHWHLIAWFRWHYVFLTVGIGVLLGIFTHNQSAIYGENISLFDIWFLVFAGPRYGELSLQSMINVLIIHIIFFYLIGYLFRIEFNHNPFAIFARMHKRYIWWFTKICTLGLITIGYIGLLFSTVGVTLYSLVPMSNSTLLVSDLLNVDTLSNGVMLQIIVMVSLLYLTTLFTLGVFQSWLAIITQESIYALIGIAILLLISWVLGTNNMLLLPFLPGSHSLVLRHHFFSSQSSLTMQISFIYNTIFFIILSSTSYIWLKRQDIYFDR